MLYLFLTKVSAILKNPTYLKVLNNMTVWNFRCSYSEHPGKKQKPYCRKEVSILCLSPNDKQVEEKLSFFFLLFVDTECTGDHAHCGHMTTSPLS